MPKTSSIDMELVLKHIEMLQAAGSKITQKTVRGSIGYGSHSTIACYLNKWRETLPLPVKTVTGLPPTPESVAYASRIQAEAEQKFKDERTEWETLLAGFKNDNAEFIALVKENEDNLKLVETERDRANETAQKALAERFAMEELLKSERAAREDIIQELTGKIETLLQMNEKQENRFYNILETRLEPLFKKLEEYFPIFDSITEKASSAEALKAGVPKQSARKSNKA